ncbi:MAG TPA: phosphoribosylaminoimidazolesuccinocarboxamide synthase [Euryarchaeota archaeon]|nr:phosphoribosylaminoimidazolesuccinocarboxamide synthase [Euryarchaeota archaeon]
MLFVRSSQVVSLKLFRQGKVKDVYDVDGDLLEFVFTDKISVFDKIIPTEIPNKGETLCRSSAFWLQMLRSLGIKTHFKEFIPPNRMRVKKVDVISDYSKITPETTNYLIPLEVISRHYVAGSLYDRIRNGKISPEEIGFPKGKNISYGEELPEPMIEMTTKLEKYDRPITKEEAMKISAISEEEYQQIIGTVLRIDEAIETEVDKRDLIHVDGKKEFAFDEKRNLIVVDTFGTADEDRWWDWMKWKDGDFAELSKEYVRQHYRNSGYYDKLQKARDTGAPEPEIPPIPEQSVEKIRQVYIDIFERITGESY